MSLPVRNCIICGTPFPPRKINHCCCRRECTLEHRRRMNRNRWHVRKAQRARERETLRKKREAMGIVLESVPIASMVLCKCPACGRMHTVKMIPPKSGITPRIYCPEHVGRRDADADYFDPFLGSYAVGW